MLAFAGCVPDEPRRLLRDGAPVHLEPQAFDVLVHLAHHADRVVPREELLDEVWGDRFVSDSALGTRIKEIRRATGDDGDAQTVIRTVRGRGYQLVATVTEQGGAQTVAVPAPVARLVGRSRDLHEVLERSRPGTLVTVVGPGGVGKSSLARACAESAGGEVVLVDLSVLDDARALAPAIGRAARLSDDDDPVVFLSGRDLLLVLDDADDLVHEVADLVAAMLRRDGSRIRLIVTCRETLGIEGEQVWPLLPLDQGASRELLVRRARELAPLAGLDELDEVELDRLTAAVDRLPLALEMLASTAGAVGVESLGSVLELGEMGISRRDAPDRHRTLDRLVSSSLDRLDEADRAALVRLSAFAGAFTGDDAVAVIGEDAVARLRSLAERSLVAPVVVGRTTRRQVLRTVRDAVRRRTPGDELQAAAEVHARYVASLLADADRRLRGPDEADAVRAFERLADEARAAHAWARAHDRPLAVDLMRSLAQYTYTRMWSEPVEWARALASTGPAEPDVTLVLATAASNLARLVEARGLVEPLLEVDGRVRLEALEILADLEIYSGHYDEAAARAGDLVEEAPGDALAHHRAIGFVDHVLGLTYGGRFDVARDALLRAATDLPHDLLSTTDLAWLRFAEGELLQLQGDPAGIGHVRAAVELAESVDNPLLAAIARATLAEVLVRDDPDAALPELVVALDTLVRRGNVTHLTGCLLVLIPELDRLGETESALEIAGWLESVVEPARQRAPLLRTLVDDVRARRDGDQVEVWLARGRAADAAAAAALAASALSRHLPTPA